MEQQPRDEGSTATVRPDQPETWSQAEEFIDRPEQMPIAAGSSTPARPETDQAPDNGAPDTGSRTRRVSRNRADTAAADSQSPAAPSADRAGTRSHSGGEFSSSAAPAGQGSNTPVGFEPGGYREWDGRMPEPGEGFEDVSSMPSMSSIASAAGALGAGGLLYYLWRRRARKTPADRLREALMEVSTSMSADLPRMTRAIGKSAAQSRSAWLPFLLLPIGLWLQQRGKTGQRAGEELLEPLKLEKRSQRLAREGADLLEERGRRWIREMGPERDSGWGWTPWLLGGAAAGGAYLAYKQGWVGTMSSAPGLTSSLGGTLGNLGSTVGVSTPQRKMVREIMTRNVETAAPDAPIQDVARRMRDQDVGSLPVTDGERLIGIVTDRDLTVRATALGKDPGNTHVREVMSPELIWVFEDEPADTAARMMRDRQIRRLPVLDRSDRLVGMLALADLATDLGDDRMKGETLEEISQPSEKAHR